MREDLTEKPRRDFSPGLRQALESRRGFALIVVILVLFLVSFLVSNLALEVRSELKVTNNIKERTAGLFLAEAGVEMCRFRKLDKPADSLGTEYEKFVLGYPYELKLGEKGRVRYYMVDESGKFDLNNVQQPQLELFFKYYGLDEEQIGILVDSLLDWRDPDDLHRLNGAEKEYYETLDDPYIPRNGALKEPDEFFLVRGAEKLRGKFDATEVFTVSPRKSGGPVAQNINFNSLTPAMLDFLVEGDKEKIAMYREFQEDPSINALTEAHAMEILGEERFGLLQTAKLLTFNATSQYYYIESIGEAGYDPSLDPKPDKGKAASAAEERHWPGLRIRAVLQLQGPKPKYLLWKETYS